MCRCETAAGVPRSVSSVLWLPRCFRAFLCVSGSAAYLLLANDDVSSASQEEEEEESASVCCIDNRPFSQKWNDFSVNRRAISVEFHHLMWKVEEVDHHQGYYNNICTEAEIRSRIRYKTFFFPALIIIKLNLVCSPEKKKKIKISPPPSLSLSG